jgi:predicted amidophosphoribosyltransferase
LQPVAEDSCVTRQTWRRTHLACLETEIAKHYNWLELKNGDTETIVVIDDVLTTGSHFRAVHDCIRANGYLGDIIGVRWARALL